MSDNKTQPTAVTPEAFIEQVANTRRREDAWTLLDIHRQVTGFEPVMWGPSIVGFDTYHYVYDSGREGDGPAAAFSPRAANMVLYLDFDAEGMGELLADLGKFKSSKACLYINKLDDVDLAVLTEIIKRSYQRTKEIHDDPVA